MEARAAGVLAYAKVLTQPILKCGQDSVPPPQWELRKSQGNQGTTFVLDDNACRVVRAPRLAARFLLQPFHFDPTGFPQFGAPMLPGTQFPLLAGSQP